MNTLKPQTYNPLRRSEETRACRYCGGSLRPCNYGRHVKACKAKHNGVAWHEREPLAPEGQPS